MHYRNTYSIVNDLAKLLRKIFGIVMIIDIPITRIGIILSETGELVVIIFCDFLSYNK